MASCGSMRVSFMNFLRLITIEPALFFFMIGIVIYQPMLQDLLRLKVCHLSFNYTWEFCDNLTKDKNVPSDNMDNINQTAPNSDNILNTILVEASNWQLYATLIQTVPAMFLSFFLGSWSDRTGRKLPMILPCIGYICATIILIFFDIYKSLPIYTILFVNIPITLTGGMIIHIMSIFSYLSDVTDEKNRTFRIAVADVALYMSQVVGSLVGGQLVSRSGHLAGFLFIISSNVVCLIYIIIWIENRPKLSQNKTKPENITARGCRGIFNIQNLRECFQTGFKKRENSYRKYILLLAFTMFAFLFTLLGEMDILLYYVNAKPLHWKYEKYTYYSAFKSLLSAICLVLVIPLFKKVLNLRDTSMAIIGSLSCIGCSLLIGFSVYDWMMYVSAPVGVLALLPAVCTRSLLTKLVDSSEQGKLFSFVASIESLAPTVASPTFNKLFQNTVSFGVPWRAIPFIVSAFMTFINVLIYGYIHIDQMVKRKYNKFPDGEENKEYKSGQENNGYNSQENITKDYSNIQEKPINVPLHNIKSSEA